MGGGRRWIRRLALLFVCLSTPGRPVVTQKLSVSMMPKVVSTAVDQNLLRITNPVSDLTGD
jgi:hypothetical protein